MHPEVIAAGAQSVPQSITSLLRIAGFPQVDALLVVELRFGDTPGMNELELVWNAFEFRQTNGPRPGS
jgi:hypothetical protein